MKRIAVIFEGSLKNITGLVNAVFNRVQHLRAISDFTIDVYDILPYPFGLTKLIHKPSKYAKKKTVEIGGVTVNILWRKDFLFDDILNYKLHKKPLYLDRFLQRQVSLFEKYDLISAHAFVGAKLALMVHERYGTPFFVTWHGSEIHSLKPSWHYQINTTKKIMGKSECNFFVSKALRNCSKDVFGSYKNDILYDGVDPICYRYDEDERLNLREKYQVKDKKVVAFVGNLVPIKNIVSLPPIFNAVVEQFRHPIEFWVIGSGEERSKLEELTADKSYSVKLWGYQQKETVAKLLQCVDVLLLPSKEEGLGLVLLEAICCGANAVGSKAGGIPEVLGDKDTFDLDSKFVEKISNRIVYYLSNKIEQPLKQDFSWEKTAQKEKEYYDNSFSDEKNMLQ